MCCTFPTSISYQKNECYQIKHLFRLISENCAFSINGIEIDLKELELYEKRLAEKRQNHPISQSVANDNTDPDDLDDYLNQLNVAASSSSQVIEANEQRDVGLASNDTEINHEMSFPLLLYGVMSIIFALSTACRQSNT